MDPKRNFTLNRESLKEDNNRIQEKVFRKWVNAQFEQGNQQKYVCDLFTDIKDGNFLCALLQVLAKITPPSRGGSLHGEPAAVDRISFVLNKLDELGVELVGINAGDIAKGNPRIVLGLLWKIILHFQIDERIELPTTPKSKEKLSASPAPADQTVPEASLSLRSWVEHVLKMQGVPFEGFEADWRDGWAFLALIDYMQPGQGVKDGADTMSCTKRLNHAFDQAKKLLNVPKLLEAADVDTDHPDEQSIMTYVALIRRPPPNRQEDTVDAASSGVELRSGCGQGQLIDMIEKLRRSVKKMTGKIQATQVKIERSLSQHDGTKESLSSLRSALSRVQPQLQKQVAYLHRHLDQQLQQTQSLSGALRHVEEQLDEEEPPEATETEERPRSIVRRLRGRLDELKARLNGSVASLQLDLIDVSQPTQHGASQSASTQTAPTEHRSSWHRTEQALQDLLCVSVATQTAQEGDNFDLQNLLNDLRESLQTLRGLLDKQDKSTEAAGGGDQTREDFVRASKEFMSSSETTCRLSACVRDSISLDRCLHDAEICLHDNTRFQQQAVEGEPNAILRQVEEHAASAERRLASLDSPETMDAHISIRETLRGQQTALHYLREAVSPPQHCVSSLQEGQQRLDSVHQAGSDLLADLQGYESPSAGASADTDRANASLQVLCDRAKNWIHDAVDNLQQLQQPLQAIRQFHENIDDPQLRSSLDKAMRDAQESERLIQDLQQPHYDLRQRRRRGQHREEQDGGGKKSGVKQGQAEESPDSFLTVLGHALCLLLLLYFWSETTASLF